MLLNGVDQIAKDGLSIPGLRSRGSEGVGLQSSFSDYLAQARNTFGHEKVNSGEDVIRESAKELVATAFLKPMFKMMREDPLRSDVIPISKGEKMFGPMLDAQMAKQMTDRGTYPLVEAIVRSLTRNTSSESAELKDKSDDLNKKSNTI